MELQDYFVNVRADGYLEDIALPRAKNITEEEAHVVAKALQLQFASDRVADVSVISETKALQDPARYLIWARLARKAEEYIQTTSPEYSENSLDCRMALAARDHVEELQRLRSKKRPADDSNKESQILEAFDKDAGQSVIFETRDTNRWGPIDRAEEVSLYGEVLYTVEEYLYRHPLGHWTLSSEQFHCEAEFSCGLELQRVDDQFALNWLVRNNYEVPPDLQGLVPAAVNFFIAGSRSPAPRAGSPEQRPVWNKDLSELSFGGKVIRRVSRGPAKNIVKVLDAFQEENWPDRIDDPLAPSKDQQRLHETISSLNDKLDPQTIRFRADGTGQGIVWYLTSQEPPGESPDIPL